MRGARIRLAAVFLVCFMIFSALVSCNFERKTKKQTVYTEYFDTVTVFTAYADNGDFSDMCAILTKNLKNYHELLDIYNTYDGVNNLKTVNDSAPTAVALGSELTEFLLWAKEAYEITDGHTNAMFGSVTSLWHNSRELELPLPPDEATLRDAALHSDIASLQINPYTSSAIISDTQASIDAGALAKGYVADVICDELTAAGYSNFLINLGGNVKAMGKKANGDTWKVGIEDPRNSKSSVCSVELKDGTSLVTSGSYQRYFEHNGTRYHHIISKDTLYPENTYLSVSVICSSSALADALSTALFNMSCEDGLELVKSLGGVEVLWIFSDEDEPMKYTNGFSKYFED